MERFKFDPGNPEPAARETEERFVPVPKLLKLALNGKSEGDIVAETSCSEAWAKTALSVARQKEFAPYDDPDARDSVFASWPPLWQKVVQLHSAGLKQVDIAKQAGCVQSTVAKILKFYRKAKKYEEANKSERKYKTRLHLFLHDLDDWDHVRSVDFGPGVNKQVKEEIDDAVQCHSPEIIFTYLSCCESQLDKLVMDLVLAVGGRCTIIADTYDYDGQGNHYNTHVAYFLRDCVKTRDFDAYRGDVGWDVVFERNIIYIDDWFNHLPIRLSPNDKEKLKHFNFWRF